ncbi:MAG: SusD/RagB family nutrient-binding outer membrane lipoprotein [Bacteroidaceae bacterium]
MITKYIYKTIFIGGLLLVVGLFPSCTDRFESMNVDPINPEYLPGNIGDGEEDVDDIDLNNKISEADLAALKSQEGVAPAKFRKFTQEGVINDYQVTTNLTHDVYAGYFANNKPAFRLLSPDYVYTDDYSKKRWNHYYQDRFKEYRELALVFKHVDKKYANAYYITRIYMAFLTSMMTDTYGDIPFSAYIQAKTPPEKASYDKQDKVYDMIFRILTQAVKNINIENNSFNLGLDDKCYGGDIAKWVRFANTLRLRLALRIVNIDPERAKKEGEAALADLNGLMMSDADKMRTVPNFALSENGGENADEKDENIFALCAYKWHDAVMSKDIERAYKEQSARLDPRCPISWYKPTPWDGLLINGVESSSTNYTGCEIGNQDIYQSTDAYSTLKCHPTDKKNVRDDYWFGYSREMVWLGYAESRFLLAEAALRSWNGTNKTPKEYFEEGVKASLAYYKIVDNLANAYLRVLAINRNPATNPFNTGDKEGMLEQIITQKWIAVFPNGNEGWAEFRRTDYPRLQTPAITDRGDVPKDHFIKRIKYPNEELARNAENVSKHLQLQGVRLWWDVADTNGMDGKRATTNNFREKDGSFLNK